VAHSAWGYPRGECRARIARPVARALEPATDGSGKSWVWRPCLTVRYDNEVPRYESPGWRTHRAFLRCVRALKTAHMAHDAMCAPPEGMLKAHDTTLAVGCRVRTAARGWLLSGSQQPRKKPHGQNRQQHSVPSVER